MPTSPPWGAGHQDLEALIGQVQLTDDSRPTIRDAALWVDQFGFEVAARILGYEQLAGFPDTVEMIEGIAARLCALGAAARTVNAVYLESTGRTDAPYDRLRKEYVEGLDQLDLMVKRMLTNFAATGNPATPPASSLSSVPLPIKPSGIGPAARVLDGYRWGW